MGKTIYGDGNGKLISLRSLLVQKVRSKVFSLWLVLAAVTIDVC